MDAKQKIGQDLGGGVQGRRGSFEVQIDFEGPDLPEAEMLCTN